MSYGKELAEREDAFLLSKMGSACKQETECAIEEFPNCVENARRTLQTAGCQPNVVILDLGLWRDQMRILRRDIRPRGLGQEFQGLPSYVGVLKGLPVVTVSALGFRGALIADFSALGNLVQYQHAESDEGFEFQLDTVDECKASELLSKNPDLRSRLRAESREDTIWLLQLHVQVTITEYLDLRLTNTDASVRIRIPKNPESDDAQAEP